jgi:hypothetical protein
MALAALLFAKGMLPQALEGRRYALGAEVEAASEDRVVQVDEAAWAAALVERYRVEPPFLRPDEITMEDPEAVQVDVSWDRTRFIRVSPTYVPGHRTVVHIPFSGEEEVFHLVSSTHIMRELHARIESGELLLDIEYPDDRPPDFKAYTGRFLQGVETNLEAARQDIQQHNAGLEQAALTAIQGRRERIERNRAHVAQTGFAITSRRDPRKTYIADVITRRPEPALPSATPGQPLELEPVLLTETYEAILHDIRQMGRSMERNPRAYANMGEEDRRHHILDALNINYRGAATAEAFNSLGRTDIRILHEGRSLFIAECKIWHGASKFTETLDQLFGYQAWRDTKLAVIMFVGEQDLTAILERAKAALEAHPQFIGPRPAQGETELRAEVCHRGDERRHADHTVLFIHTPLS